MLEIIINENVINECTKMLLLIRLLSNQTLEIFSLKIKHKIVNLAVKVEKMTMENNHVMKIYDNSLNLHLTDFGRSVLIKKLS